MRTSSHAEALRASRARLAHWNAFLALGEVVVMRFSEFLKYLIVLLLLAIVLVAVSR